jgi:fatty acid desaturase
MKTNHQTNQFLYINQKYSFDTDIKKSIKSLCQYDNVHCFLGLSADFIWIAFGIYLSCLSFYFYPLTLLIIGSRQRALATLLHDATHHCLAKNKTLNKILGTFFSGYLIFQTWEAYQKSHVYQHHVRLGDPKLDPDFKYYLDSGLYQTISRWQFFYRFFLKPLLFLNVPSSFVYLVKNRLMDKKVRAELFWMLVSLSCFIAIGTYLTNWTFFFLYWLVPYLTVFQTLTWFIEVSEHYPLVAGATVDIDATHNRFSHPIEGFFTSMHHENFHLIHHLFPAVPFWNMKKAHQVLLNDPVYAQKNACFGGIFLSGNHTKSQWTHLLFGQKIQLNTSKYS